MLCRRSASLMTMTRMSWLMATSILRMVATWVSVRVSTSMRVILVTPSTSSATVGLKRRATSSLLTSQSSTTSCRRAAVTVCISMLSWLKIMATSTGWTM